MTVVDDRTEAPPARNGSTPAITAPLTELRPPAAPTPPPPPPLLESDDDLVVAEEEFVAAPGSARMLTATRLIAVGTTALIGLFSFALSFASLRDLALKAGYWWWIAPLWPLIVDGTILAATMGVMALGPYGRQQRRNRLFFWIVLIVAALVSVLGNGLHAWLPPDAPLNPWLKAAVGVVPPVSLLLTAHGAAILSRVRPMTMKAVRAQVASQQAKRAEDRRQHFLSVAQLVKEQNPTRKAIAERPTEQIAEVLALTHDGESQRSVCNSLGLHHDTVRTIIQAGAKLKQPTG